MDFLSDNFTILAALGLAGLWLVVRVFSSFRVTVSRPKGKKLTDIEAAAYLADMHLLAVRMEECANKARQKADAARDPGGGDAPVDLLALDFDLPHRFQGNLRRLEKLPAPFGPLAALAVRKAQTLQHRLRDPNWEAMQRREGADTPGIYDRLARDFGTAAAQARRAERQLREATPSPTRLHREKH